MLLIIKTGDETCHSVALRLDLLKGVDLDALLETAINVTGQRDSASPEPWVEVKSSRPTFEIVDEERDVTVEAF